jgi:uncharacterized membrane protein
MQISWQLTGGENVFGLLPMILIFILLLPAFFFLFYFNIAAISFTKLGLSPQGAMLLFTFSLIGSVINIPVSKQKIVVEEKPQMVFPFLFYYPPRVRHQVIAVNVGGAIIPTVFALYLLTSGKTPLVPALVSTTIVTLATNAMARVVPGVGISLPAFIPPLVAVSSALLLGGESAAPIAYIAGSLGTLIGADLLNLHKIKNIGAQVVSIGGAGVYDGIFLVGVIAAFLAA